MTQPAGITRVPTRRTVVAAAGAAGLAVTLAACGDDGGSDGGGQTVSEKPADSGGSDDSGSDDASGGSGGQAGGGGELGRTADIPKGGGKVFKDQKVVVTQPSAGTYKAFSAVCTHQGCVVAEVTGGTINCPCHGSKFAIADGSVAGGPATKPLPGKQVTVKGDSIVLD